MDFLAAHNFNLLISLDGDKKSNEYRVFKNGDPAYPVIFKNVLKLKNKYPDYFNEKVNFSVVFHNKNSVDEIYRHFKDEFGKTPNISELNTNGIREEKKEEFWNTYANIYESLYRSEDYSFIEKDMFIKLPNIRSIGLFIHKHSGSVFRNYNDLVYSGRKRRKTPTGTCLPFSKKMFVTVNGKILPCERIGQQFGLGYVDEEKVLLDVDDIANKYNDYYEKIRKQCTTCFNADGCQQCIFHLNIDDDKPYCQGYFNKDDFSQYLSSHISYLEDKPETYSRIMREVVVE
jgi:uncharacterized protein